MTETVLLSLALSLDTAAVALSVGFATPELHARQALRMASVFFAFHVAMPLIGYAMGAAALRWVQAVDHWIAAGLLTMVGIKMLHEAWERRQSRRRGKLPEMPPNAFAWRPLLALALATSIDALGAGFTLHLLPVPVLVALFVLGATPFGVTLGALRLGRRIGDRLGALLDAAGGLMLLGLAARVLVEHLG
jgi:putative Mn2+ efflux pump MntP